MFVVCAERLSQSTGKSVLKHKSIDVVGFVLKTASERSGADDFGIAAKLILAATNDVIGANRRCVRAGK
jgi:hypothetical protein